MITAGQLAGAMIRLAQAVNEHRIEAPELQVGNQSFRYRFGSIQPGDNAANFRGVIVDVADDGQAKEAMNAHVQFWTNSASRHAPVGATDSARH